MRTNYDAQLRATVLPSGTSPVYSPAIDLGPTPGHIHMDVVVTAPDHATLAENEYVAYHLEHGPTPSGTWTDLQAEAFRQTAGGAGAAAATYRTGLPSDCGRYVRLAAQCSAVWIAADEVIVEAAL